MLKAGDRTPEFKLPTTSGLEIVSSPPVNGLMVLAFFKVSCPTCQYTFPYLERIAAGRVPVVGISQNGLQETAEFATEFGLTFPLALDDESVGYPVSNAFRITHVPSIFLVTSNRTIDTAWSGCSRSELENLGRRFSLNPFREGEKTPEFKPG